MDDTELRFLLVSGHGIGNAGSVCCPRNHHGSLPKCPREMVHLVQFGRKPWNGMDGLILFRDVSGITLKVIPCKLLFRTRMSCRWVLHLTWWRRDHPFHKIGWASNVACWPCLDR